MTNYNPYKDVKTFHTAFGHPVAEEKKPIQSNRALARASWKVEEIVEFLHASSDDLEDFLSNVEALRNSLDKAEMKELSKHNFPGDDNAILVGQVDSMIDLLYFAYGSFVEMGIDPAPFFQIVQNANMGKLDPTTGKPIIRESDGKIMKPDNWEKDFAPEAKISALIKNGTV